MFTTYITVHPDGSYGHRWKRSPRREIGSDSPSDPRRSIRRGHSGVTPRSLPADHAITSSTTTRTEL